MYKGSVNPLRQVFENAGEKKSHKGRSRHPLDILNNPHPQPLTHMKTYTGSHKPSTTLT